MSTATAANPPPAGSITLRCLELFQFRRLGDVRLELDAQTTILVGANNSGKTSVLAALRHFLSDSSSFGAFDISLCHWTKLRALGKSWEALVENPSSTAGDEAVDWKAQLRELLDAMPTLDLWLDAQPGMYHFVSPFLSAFTWKGGAVGMRLRLEPASDIAALQSLAWAYREARFPVKDMGAESLAWPIDLLDFWLREPGKLGQVKAYKLDAARNPLDHRDAYVRPPLPANAVAVERKYLTRLIRVDFVAAQRGLGSEEIVSRSSPAPHRVGMFSNQLMQFARRHLNVAVSGHAQRVDLIKAVAEAQKDLDRKIHDAIAPSVAEVKALGYPSLHDPQEIRFRTRIQTADLLDHGTAVQYSMQKGAADDLLPEHSIGLGYQNLQSLSYQLVSFKTARMNPEKGSPEPLHLVMIEEPEAHLHVQVQRIFPDKAHKLISPTDKDASALKSQLLLSTHSSHLAHAEDFDRLRYFRRVGKTAAHPMPTTEVVNLDDVFGSDIATRRFAERYFRVQHTDLLFANAVIFVEGVAERMLVPLFMERDFEPLNSRYVSFLDIGGSHAHRLKPLVEKLRIPAVVITDIDPVEKQTTPKGRTVWRAVANTGQSGLRTGNASLRTWHPALQELVDYKGLGPDRRVWKNAEGCEVHFAWQQTLPGDGSEWPSTFEDSLVLANIDWFKKIAVDWVDANGQTISAAEGTLGDVAEAVVDARSNADLMKALHELMRESFSKGDFAASVFEQVAAGEPIQCPSYIADALKWLQEQLDPATGAIA